MNRCIPMLVEEGKNKDQAVAVCSSMFGKKSIHFSSRGVIEIKELEDALIIKGFIATTHFDGQDIITKETLEHRNHYEKYLRKVVQ